MAVAHETTTGCRNPRRDELPSDCPGPNSDAADLQLCWPCHHLREYGKLPMPYDREAREGSA